MADKGAWTDKIALPIEMPVTVDPNKVPGRVGVRNEDGQVWIQLQYQEYRTPPITVECACTPIEAMKLAEALRQHAVQAGKGRAHGR